MSGTPPPGAERAADRTPVKRSVRLLRVSSRGQTDTDYDRDPEGNSIDTQRKVTVAKERAMKTVNVGEYVEAGYSGQSIDKRPFFQELLQRIADQRDVDYVVIYMRSRIFRNYVEAAIVKQQLAKLGVKLVSAKEDFGDGLMAEAMEAVTDVFNWLQVRMSGEDIKIKMANKARNGGTIGKAKVGYLNQRILIDGHKINTVVPDPERAHFIPMAFELFATGRETVASLRATLTTAVHTHRSA
jgi:site-specific DNA recombinase